MTKKIVVFNLKMSTKKNTWRLVFWLALLTKKSACADLVNQIGLLNGWPDNLAGNVPNKSIFVKRQNEIKWGVDSPGIEPGRFGLSDQPNKPVEPTPYLL